MRENCCIVIVPADVHLKEGVGHEHERIGSKSGKLGQPLIERERQPLAGTVDRWFSSDGNSFKVGLKHL